MFLATAVGFSVCLGLGCAPAGEAKRAKSPEETTAEEATYSRKRAELVDRSLAGEIRDARVLAAMRKVPRHRFVPEEQREHAYEDRPLPIGEDQTISQPFVVALMTELLELGSHSRVLEVGTGSGYQAAILAEIAADVYTIEIVEPLAQRAAATLAELGYDSVHVRTGDGYRGWPEVAPFDAIIVTCAPDHVPTPLQEQLAEGGRLVIPVGTQAGQELFVIVKTGGKLVRRDVIPVTFVPMTGPGVEAQPDSGNATGAPNGAAGTPDSVASGRGSSKGDLPN